MTGKDCHSLSPIDTHHQTPQIDSAMRYPKPYYDACKLQDKLMQVIDVIAPKDLAGVSKGYATLEALKLRIRMKPAPKPIDVSKPVAKKVKPGAGFEE